tara:strand:+ start:234 stop:530 length:297 start_codon:yes stop_codon:yes gene_type:complete
MDELEVNETYKINGSLCLDRDYIELDNVSVQVTEKNSNPAVDYISFQIQEKSIDIVNQAIEKTDNKDHLQWLLWEDLKGEIGFFISEPEYYEDIIITK